MVKLNNEINEIANGVGAVAEIHIACNLQKLQLEDCSSKKRANGVACKLAFEEFQEEIVCVRNNEIAETERLGSKPSTVVVGHDKENNFNHQQNFTPSQENNSSNGHFMVAATPHSNASFPVELRKRRHIADRLTPPYSIKTPVKARKSLVF